MSNNQPVREGAKRKPIDSTGTYEINSSNLPTLTTVPPMPPVKPPKQTKK